MTLHPGMMITPSLRLVRQLGEGGMGSVWEAEHLTLHSRVAVKCLSATMLNNVEAKARFEREALAAAQIRSPHVVGVLDHGFGPDGTPFIVLEMLEGEDLASRLARQRVIEPVEMGRIVSHICKALSKAHSLGIVHRDIKPDNIFLTDIDGEPFAKILDFGIAKRTEDHSMGVTSTGVMIGTPYYMSPEQVLSSKDVDSRADLWSLAVVVYHCLTGRRPFEGETIGALCIAIDRAKFPVATTVRPELPASIDRFFQKALCRNPDGRFASAREMEQEFLGALSGMPSGTRLSLSELSLSHSFPPISIQGGVTPRAPDAISQPTLSGQQTIVRGLTTRRRTVAPFLVAAGMVLAATAGWHIATRSGDDERARSAAQPPPSASAPDPALSASAALAASAAPSVANVEELPRATKDDAADKEPAKDQGKEKEPSKDKDQPRDRGDASARKPATPPRKVKDRGF
jgi:eukaryotic-like serine/threonine-protein kinase